MQSVVRAANFNQLSRASAAAVPSHAVARVPSDPVPAVPVVQQSGKGYVHSSYFSALTVFSSYLLLNCFSSFISSPLWVVGILLSFLPRTGLVEQ